MTLSSIWYVGGYPNVNNVNNNNIGHDGKFSFFNFNFCFTLVLL